MKWLFAFVLYFMATFQNGTTNAFIGPNHLRRHSPTHPALDMVPQHEEPDGETSYFGDNNEPQYLLYPEASTLEQQNQNYIFAILELQIMIVDLKASHASEDVIIAYETVLGLFEGTLYGT